MATPVRKRLFFGCALCALWGFYCLTGTGASGDSRWTVPAALSLLREGNLDVDEYLGGLEPASEPTLEQARGRYHSIFPVGAVLMAAPFLGAGELALGVAVRVLPGLEPWLRARLPAAGRPLSLLDFYWRAEQMVAALFMASAAGIMFLTARHHLPLAGACLIGIVFALCTPVWSVGTTALWQHGPSLLILCLVVLLLQGPGSGARVGAAGALLAFSFVVRPTNALPVLFISAYILYAHRGYALAWAGGMLPVLGLFALYNAHLHGSLLPPYYQGGRLSWHAAFPEALAGNLISPGRGLFVYAPVLMFSVAGLGLRLRDGAMHALDWALAATVTAHWVVISAFPHWWAGVSYGPRLFTDMAPFLVWFLIPVCGALLPGASFPPSRRRGCCRQQALRVAFVCSVLVSAFMQYQGASRQAAWHWNLSPVHIDDAPERVWDWCDPAFLR